ncbi:3-phosphoshikimate 1-carboxyvinyltransferase [Rudanella paleaurantiibacter]|uniref:3-phosphoshikimate 1-carboxyvinyltransferase n=1 Tax=Rudanella paleaurantiibacter TaxID=2614655 RepID=A0A7J5U7J3_9BACT|nr:3-phosphoshikimate 1-carboxyvinyltransferase [Rudanella paleaurantiibacter]KAB7733130.1 3-phosphoshikimate 1-carboxyvinyltransferase [Rudanella paleaurantiibacter]
MTSLRLTPPEGPVRATIPLASSKSESNRALIINALTQFKGEVQNLATARDTQTMIRLLASTDEVADVLDAGTTMRFLTAYFAATGQQKTLTGTPRMCERPIGLLVEALRTLGADITYLQKDGYPPLRINGFTPSGADRVAIRGDVSSQYISALLMIAPTLPTGLTIELTGEVGSRPYIEMTIEQMRHFGASVQTDWEAQTLTVAPQPYTPTTFAVESDWSGASYWYSVVALAEEGSELELLGLKAHSLQGDSAIQTIMRAFGVESTFTERGVRLTKIPAQESLTWDYTGCPDLAQTVAVCAAMTGIPHTLTGIESLKIKETDRVLALQNELQKLGAELVEVEPNTRYEVRPLSAVPAFSSAPSIHTYDDHRMAMAFAPVAMRRAVVIEEPGVVAKSYPSFWDDFRQVAGVE